MKAKPNVHDLIDTFIWYCGDTHAYHTDYTATLAKKMCWIITKQTNKTNI